MAEFLGTFMLVFTVGCNVMAVKTDPHNLGVFVAQSIAAVLMISIYALGTALPFLPVESACATSLA
jgi:glycerol uptake facilitator-like aquaporin